MMYKDEWTKQRLETLKWNKAHKVQIEPKIQPKVQYHYPSNLKEFLEYERNILDTVRK